MAFRFALPGTETGADKTKFFSLIRETNGNQNEGGRFQL
jgi:hypothetical protein